MSKEQEPRPAARRPSKLAERLRLAREATGTSVDDAGRAARVPTRYIQMLEESRYPMVSDPTYLVPFLRRYAGFLGLDVEHTAREFIEEADTEAARATTLPEASRKSSTKAERLLAERRSLGARFAYGMLAVAVLIGAGYAARTWSSPPGTKEAPTVEASAVPVAEEPPSEPPAVASELAPAAPAIEVARAETPPAPAKVEEPSPAPEPPRGVASAPPAAAPAPAAVATAPFPTVPGLQPPFELQITATAREVWVWVSADGGPRRATKLTEGKSATWTAQQGYLVSIDDVGGVRATLNGAPLRNLGESRQAKRNLVIPSPELFPARDG